MEKRLLGTISKNRENNKTKKYHNNFGFECIRTVGGIFCNYRVFCIICFLLNQQKRYEKNKFFKIIY